MNGNKIRGRDEKWKMDMKKKGNQEKETWKW